MKIQIFSDLHLDVYLQYRLTAMASTP